VRRTRSTGLATLVVAATAVLLSARDAAAQDQDQNQDLINPDRPGIADGSKVIAPGQFQLETGLQYERHDVDFVFVPTLLRVGALTRLEFRVEGNTLTHADGQTGFAPISLGAKIAVVQSDDGPTLGVIVRGFLASGTSQFKDKHFTSDIRVAADMPLGKKFSLNPNAGAARYEDNGQIYTAGLFAMTLNYQPTDRLNPFIDVAYQSSTGAGTSAAVTLDAGVAWIIGNDIQLDVSVGQGLNGDAPRPFVAGGFSIRLGRHRR
jgi:hypothetical protein